MKPAFTNPITHRRWDSYFAEVDRLISSMGPDANELRLDLAAHVADSMSNTANGSELDRLNFALTRLGRPIDYLRPLLADELIERGARTYSPVTIARGLSHAVLTGSRRTVIALAFGTGYLLLAIFTAMALLKPVWGDHVGLFRHANGTISAGIVHTSTGTRELLGFWSIPIAIVLSTLLYVALTKGLRIFRSRP